MEVLHLSEHVPKGLGMQTGATPRRSPGTFRDDQCRVAENAADIRIPRGAECLRIGADSRAGHVAGHVVALEELCGERPELRKRALHAPVALVGAISEAKRPVGGMVAVVLGLLH